MNIRTPSLHTSTTPAGVIARLDRNIVGATYFARPCCRGDHKFENGPVSFKEALEHACNNGPTPVSFCFTLTDGDVVWFDQNGFNRIETPKPRKPQQYERSPLERWLDACTGDVDPAFDINSYPDSPRSDKDPTPDGKRFQIDHMGYKYLDGKLVYELVPEGRHFVVRIDSELGVFFNAANVATEEQGHRYALWVSKGCPRG